MARKVLELVTCDVCAAEGAHPWMLKEGEDGRRPSVRVDLCEQHAAPMRDAVERGGKVKAERHSKRKAGQHSIAPYEPA